MSPRGSIGTLAILAPVLLPVVAGIGATVLPAFGYLPALGGHMVSLDPWRALLTWPGLPTSLLLTLRTGLAATALSLASAVALACLARRAGWLGRLMPPVLAMPHSALAIGLAFLIAPSGWLARLVSPWLTGWNDPPNIATVQDAWGVALVLGLWLKETPYLLLMLLAALARAEVEQSAMVAASLGYGPWRGWLLAILPRVWPRIRLPVLAVLAFSLSVVDVPLILGPSSPPTLAVQVLQWFSDPDLANWFIGSAGAVLLACLIGACAVLALAGEAAVSRLGRRAIRSGRRGGDGVIADVAAGGLLTAWGALGAAALLVLVLWSFAQSWRFPAALPRVWSGAVWITQAPGLAGAAWTTVALGAAVTLLALVLAVACLELGAGGSALVYAPLLVPQIGFLFGMQIVLLRLGLDGGALALGWAHLVFVMPYVFLALADPWAALDPRYGRSAAALGASPARVLLRVTLPLLARPVLAAGATGFAVSAGLYLPTLFAGGGRWRTLTTEAVTLAAGGDRRQVAATALLQAAVPLGAFALAVRRRR